MIKRHSPGKQQAQTALDRTMRAKGLGSSRFGAKAQADLGAELAAKETDRRMQQLMDMYRSAGALGSQMGGNYMTAGSNLSNLYSGAGAKQAGLYQDVGRDIATPYGAAGTSKSQALAAAAGAEAPARCDVPERNPSLAVAGRAERRGEP